MMGTKKLSSVLALFFAGVLSLPVGNLSPAVAASQLSPLPGVTSTLPASVYDNVWVTITGDPMVGNRLEIQPFAYNPSPTQILFQWLANGQPIPGASGNLNSTRSYATQASDIGARISVDLQLTHPDGQTRTIRSNEIGPITERNWITTRAPSTGCVGEVGELCITTSNFDILRSWSPQPTSITYQWFADGVPIPASTCFSEVNRCLRLTTDHLNKRITVQVTGQRAGYPSRTETSLATQTVRWGSMRWITIPEPQIIGTLRVNETIRVNGCCGGWDPVPTATQPVEYQWFANGRAIAGATQTTLTLTSALEGQRISVRVSAGHDRIQERGVRTSGQTSPVQAAFVPPPLDWSNVTGSVVIRGEGMCCPLSPVVGQQLTADASTHIWSPRPASISYQWLADGVPLSGETGFRLTVTEAHEGKRISVRVTGTHPDISRPAVETSSSTFAVQNTGGWEPWASVGAVDIRGELRVGQRISVALRGWSPQPTSLQHQWRRNGVQIIGETGPTYLLQPADEGQRISVSVTANRQGYRPAQVTTPGLFRAGAARQTEWASTPAPRLVGQAEVGQSLTIQMGDWLPTPQTISYQWFIDGSPVSGQTGSTYRIRGEDINRRITVEARANHPETGQLRVLMSTSAGPVTLPNSNGNTSPGAQPGVTTPNGQERPGRNQDEPVTLNLTPPSESSNPAANELDTVVIAPTPAPKTASEIVAAQSDNATGPVSGAQVMSSSLGSSLATKNVEPAQAAIISLQSGTAGLVAASADFFDLGSAVTKITNTDAEQVSPTRFEDWVGAATGSVSNASTSTSTGVTTVTGNGSAYCPANFDAIGWSIVEPSQPPGSSPRGLAYSTFQADLQPHRLGPYTGARASNGQQFLWARTSLTGKFTLQTQFFPNPRPWTPVVRVECEAQVRTAPATTVTTTTVSQATTPVAAPQRFTVQGTRSATCPSNSTYVSGRVIIPQTQARGLSYEEYSATGSRVGNSFVARNGVKTIYERSTLFSPFRILAQGAWTPSVAVTCQR